ncbi:MAG: alpha-1,2-fucosyltransferase [Candidatus Magasanikbacteria bacterium CG_4_9_14_3_um_filter_32_9]|uniref:Alpha-1,2-fucosyltransferase n=1 Tax=Candidatus Magasanikbacteria bacterium CG_4_9_14_3_um_filter_32_9 TaxID=1974644 RepID=A0A2M7Z6N2_9BACT|nr:MAG: alpha-1,2-fucosyltransferase [Candidatus Magasanikbacteria bacterium CG_4_9_14_3_um_filter_32_9]
MIIIKLKGGLGNQLFQYSFGRLLAFKRNEELFLDKDILGAKKDSYRQFGLKHFNITGNVATPEEIKKTKYPFGIFSKVWRGFKGKILKIHNIGWNPRVLDSKKSYFDGYWQSYKYPDTIRKILLKELTLKIPIENKYSKILEKINNPNSISLHIRRGDYINDPKTSKVHNICDLDYYTRAVKDLADKLDNPIFFIFSDDIEWVKENLKIDFPMIFVSGSGIEDYEELILMSKCKHNIIANSSFSWWGAWFNSNEDKIVIAPKKWNNDHPEKFKDLIPESWIKI